MLPALIRIPSRLRGRHLFAIDFVGAVIGSYFALAVRYDQAVPADVIAMYLPILATVLAVRTVVNVRLGLYQQGWRFASIPDLERIVAAAALGTLVSLGLVTALEELSRITITDGFPRSYWLIELLITGGIVGGARFAIRAASEWSSAVAARQADASKATLLYGAGRTGVLMARSAMRRPGAGVRPVGFLDDDPSTKGSRVAGLNVYGGIDALEAAVAATGARALLITMPSASGSSIRGVVERALALGLEVRTIPSLLDLLDGTVDAYRARRVRVEDLLRRPIATEHSTAVTELIRDRIVVITGAGGSIGSELARQVFAIGPRRLVLVDRAESPLYMIQRELERVRGSGHLAGEIRVHLANVASRAAMSRLVATEHPNVILHAAAYKHVPMMEEHPSDAVHVNIGGTLALLDAAIQNGVDRFVLVSTDKAVRPTSVMGASKRVAEMLVSDAARRIGRPFVAVRFGNVLGSTGSVVPIFQEQLENGQPLTITDAEMTRFFMTIPEASWLILDALSLGEMSDLFVLDMGDPVRIIDLARDLIRLAGRDPDSHPIEVIGLRKGEKLHEELFYAAERVEPTPTPKVLRASTAPPPATLRDDVRVLLEMADGQHEPELAAALLAYATLGERPLLGDLQNGAPIQQRRALGVPVQRGGARVGAKAEAGAGDAVHV